MTTITTTRHTPKAFSWSYSKLKNFRSCPKKHYHVDVAKDVKEAESDELKWGNLVHKRLAERLSKGTALPVGMERYEKWCQQILAGGGNILVEQQLAIDKNFGPCKWFGDEAWYRGIADVLKIMGPVALAVDWKTGRILEDSVQLGLMAQCVFSHYPEIQRIRTEFIWLKEDASSRADFKREDMPTLWRGLWPSIEELKHAHDTMTYPAKKGGLCRNWCPVKACPHNGEA